MSARALTWLLVTTSFLTYLAVLLRLRTRSTGTFYRPMQRVRPVSAGVAAAAGWISAASYLSLGGALAVSPWDGAVYLAGWTAGFALLTLLAAPYFRRSGRETIPALVAERFRSPAAGAIAASMAVLVTFTYLSAQLRGAAIVLARFVPLPLPWAVAAAAAVVLLYTTLGPLRTLTGGQVAQYLVLATAFAVLAGAVSLALTGSPIPQLAWFGHLSPRGAGLLRQPAGSALRAALEGLAREVGPLEHGAGLRGSVDRIAILVALLAGTAALPHMVSRFLAMPRARDARASAGWGLCFIVLFYSAVPAVALAARAGLLASEALGAPATWMAGWVPSGLVSGGGPALRVHPDVLVVAAPEMLGLPPWVTAVAAAGALAAAVSAGAGLVLSMGAAAGRDLLGALLPAGAAERIGVPASRTAAAALTAVAALLALHPPGTVVETVALAFGLAAAAFLPALLAVAFWPRATRPGVLAGMAAGASFTVGYVHWFRFAHPELDDVAHWWLGISPEGIGTVGTLLGGAMLVAVSLLTVGPDRPTAPA
ncbi:MAG TPA: VC_2705 family sodium/solute symporter [Anaeromyxobacter sp.]|nr:VC_2705 family sodium/solute symporter [Anaeromyxobacter sp.]